jgi:hypothetical protein
MRRGGTSETEIYFCSGVIGNRATIAAIVFGFCNFRKVNFANFSKSKTRNSIKHKITQTEKRITAKRARIIEALTSFADGSRPGWIGGEVHLSGAALVYADGPPHPDGDPFSTHPPL